jgi:hypothetical protein
LHGRISQLIEQVEGGLGADIGPYAMNQIRFADGTIWDVAYITQRSPAGHGGQRYAHRARHWRDCFPIR